MKKTWQIQEAKASFSKVIKEANIHGPQQITYRGELIAVIISNKEYEHLKCHKTSLVDFMQSSPLKNAKLALTRDKTFDRQIDL